MTGPPAWMLRRGWFGLGGVQVRTARCTEAAREVSRVVLRARYNLLQCPSIPRRRFLMWEGSSWLAGYKRSSCAGRAGKTEHGSLSPLSMQREILRGGIQQAGAPGKGAIAKIKAAVKITHSV